MKKLTARWIKENSLTVEVIEVKNQRFARRDSDKSTGYGGTAIVKIANANTGKQFEVDLNNADTISAGDICEGVEYEGWTGNSYGLQEV
jgi:hypothetical protein